jgi:hypothetical protein
MEIEFTVQIDAEKRRHEWHASVSFAIAGSLALLLFGLSCPPLWFCLAGIWFPMSMACFARYRKMRRQELRPDKLRIQGDELVYLSEGKPSFSILLSDVRRIEARYGIQIFTHELKRIKLLDPNFPLAKFLAQSKKQKCDLFFRWFDASSKARLEDIVHPNQSHHTGSL